jgi:hypothetical protein
MFIKLAKTTKSATVILLLTLTISDIFYIFMEAVSVLFASSTFYEFPFTIQQRIQQENKSFLLMQQFLLAGLYNYCLQGKVPMGVVRSTKFRLRDRLSWKL